MELEEAKKILNEFIQDPVMLSIKGIRKEVEYEAIETVLNHITKQDKMINLMVEHIETDCDFDNRITNKVQIKKYFEKKVEENK